MMCRAGSWRQLASLLAPVLLGAVLANSVAIAQERSLTAVSPATVKQGDTLLLTIEGENLPTGSVTVEFFPQQIALLDILSADKSKIEAQIKVPNLATPGPYNVLVYNHLGDEAFGQGLLTVASEVLTPVFRDFDPKVIAQATGGFALLLSGEGITTEVAWHLSMQWRQGEREVVGLETTFTKGGPGQILCAVTGDLPSGVLVGRVFLDGVPIYLVEITIESPTGWLVGHRPAQLPVDVFPYDVTLLGVDLSASYVQGLSVELGSSETTARPRELALLDPSSARVLFSGPLPSGEYDLVVARGPETVYEGMVSLVLTEAPPAEAPAGGPTDSTEAASPEELPAEIQPGAPARPPAEPETVVISVAPLTIPAGDRPASLAFTGAGLDAAAVERLSIELSVDGEDCGLLFLGAGGQACTCLFAPPAGGWKAGTRPRLEINDPQTSVAFYETELLVEAAEPPAAAVPSEAAGTWPEPPAGERPLPATPSDGRWSVTNVYVDEGLSGDALVVVLDAPDASWDPALLDADFTLLPVDPLTLQSFGNLSLSGQLSFRRSESGVPIGSYRGNFVAGDLLIELSYDQGPHRISSMFLAAAPPRAELAPAPAEYIRRDMATGEFSPETLRCVVEFSPLVIADPSFLNVEFSPAPTGGQAVYLESEGTRVVLLIDLAAWRDVEDWEEGLSVDVSSLHDLRWRAEPLLRLPVQQAAAEVPVEVIEMLTRECPIGDRGFSLELDAGRFAVPVKSFEVVEVSSDHLLLDRNLSAFDITAAESGTAVDRIVSLRFTRNAAALDELAYGLLLDELLECEAVELRLVWPALAAEALQTVRFVARDEAGASEVLDELGLIVPD